MRGVISEKLAPFLAQANEALAESKKQGVQFSPALVRSNLDKLAPLIGEGPALSFVQDRAVQAEERAIAVRVMAVVICVAVLNYTIPFVVKLPHKVIVLLSVSNTV